MRVREDSNANGIQDLTESGLSGVQLGLNGTDGCGLAVSKIATTNSNGYYLFTDLVPGNYI
ncbi:MAG: hypothetical protein IPN89_09300 [Saprospiraceae bacterium]|nr:hypothetical protein [Saprospiraceae bacterium]